MRGRGKSLNSRLAESEFRYQSVFNHSFDGILLTSPDGRILAANPAACRMFGRSEEEMCRLGRDGIMNLADPRLNPALEQRERTGKFAGELTGLRNDGTVFPVELTTSVFTDSNGEQRTSMIIRDITLRNKTVEELEAKEAALRAILENTDSFIWSVDRHFRYLYGNTAYLSKYMNATGRPVTPGDDVTQWLPEDQREKWRGYFMQGISGISFTTMSSTGAGNQKQYMRFSFNPVRNIAGEVTGVTVMGTDVTDLMLMQKDLVKTGTMLREAGETLRRLNMHIEEAREKERSEIAMNLHDDLGQKLTALQMNLSWLRKRIGVQSDLVSGKLDELEEIIKSSIGTVQKISSDLRPAILYELGLKDAVEWHMQQNLEPSGIKGTLTLAPEDLQFDTKISIVLFRIIQEAITNIIRHSGADRTEIGISRFLSYAELIIRDNGRGIEQGAVNDPTSFGISSIRERVKNFEGQFRITGEKGKGTILIVRIPISQTQHTDDQGNNNR